MNKQEERLLFVSLISLALSGMCVPNPTQSHHYTRLIFNTSSKSCTILEQREVRNRAFKGFSTNSPEEVKVLSRPSIRQIDDQDYPFGPEVSEVVEIWGKREKFLLKALAALCKTTKPLQSQSVFQDAPEIRKIVDGGPQENRIDVVFMGDGYTREQRSSFFSDIQRLTVDMFQGPTFRSYLPLFNVWAIFLPSWDSGIGYDGPKNTTFKLYRQRGQLRAVYTGAAGLAREVCALVGPGGCDYPSLIGNDDYYGGLGGEFVISTKSERTGTVVLRHEMGHNFGDVGEEYDGGGVYRGVNSAKTPESLGWSHWLTNSSSYPPRAERAIYRILQYPWVDLWAEGPQLFNFTSDGTYSRWLLSVSVSAAGERDSLEFALDGVVLPWTSTGYDDREFYSWTGEDGFGSGAHTLSIRSKTPPTHPTIPRMICSVRLHEFGDESEFAWEHSVVSAYPTWDLGLGLTYRPTNAGCLMRNMTYEAFCPVCKEGMWIQFLQRIHLIEHIRVADVGGPGGGRGVLLSTLKLGQLRGEDGEWLHVRWYKDGVEEVQLRDQFVVDEALPGAWRVVVVFESKEIRRDVGGVTREEREFIIEK